MIRKVIVGIILMLGLSLSSCSTIHSTAKDGKPSELQDFLSDGVDINSRDINNFTPLMIASREGKDENVKFLLTKGADVNAKGVTGITALMLAAGRNHDTTVLLLINKGAELEAKTSSKEEITALGVAAMKSSDKAFKILLDNGARIDMKASHQFTVVDLALGNWVKVNKEYSLAIIEKVRSAGQIDNTAIWTARLDAMANIIKLLKNKKYKPHESTIEQMGKEASSFNDIIKIQGFSYIPPIFIPWE